MNWSGLELLTVDGNSKGSRTVLPLYAVAAATAPRWVPYIARVGNAVYVGISSNIEVRAAQHAARFAIEEIKGVPKMNYAAAKGFA